MSEVLFWTSLIIYSIIVRLDLRWGVYLLLAILPAFLLRWQIAGIPTTWLELAIYLAVAIFFINQIKQKKLKQSLLLCWQNYKYLLAAMALWLTAAVLATIFSPNIIRSAGALKGWWIDPMLLILLIASITKTSRHLSQLILFALSGITLVSVYGLVEIILGVGLRADKLLNSVFVSANYVAMLLVPILILSISWIFYLKTNARSKISKLLTSLIAINITALLLTKSLGGIAAFIGGLTVMFYSFSLLKQKSLNKKFLWLILLVAISVALSWNKINLILTNPNISSLATRQQIWQTALTLIKENPLTGVGLGNFENPYRQTVVQLFKHPLELEVVKAHNLYLNTWAEMGIFGLIVLILIVAIFGWQIKKNLKGENCYTVCGFITIGAFAAMIAILIHGLVDTPYFKNDLSIVFWLVFSLPFIMHNLTDNFDKTQQK